MDRTRCPACRQMGLLWRGSGGGFVLWLPFMNIERLDHVALVCSDVSVSQSWYERVFGFQRIFSHLWGGNPVFLELGSIRLALFQATSEASSVVSALRGPRLDHFALLAPGLTDLDLARAELREKGVSYQIEDHEVSVSLYCQDPDGHTVEITAYRGNQ